MLILGLGTNQGHRLQNLRKTIHLLRNHPDITLNKISSVYQSDAMLPTDAPSHWKQPYYNCALACHTTLSPEDLLAVIKHIEKQMGRSLDADRWSPRIIDIDMLAWDNLILTQENLTIPHPGLLERPFALWPLQDIANNWIHPITQKSTRKHSQHWGSVYEGKAPYHTKQLLLRADTPQLVGILNLTDNSFTEDGVGDHIEKAIIKANRLYQQGAEIMDIGAESTHPLAPPVSTEHQWQRLKPVLEILHTEWRNDPTSPSISIDTRSPEVAARAIRLGVDWINDTSGLSHPEMCEAVANTPVNIVSMHHHDIRSSLESPVLLIQQWIEQQVTLLEKNAIALNRIIFDIGVGFGKTAEQSLEILQNIGLLRHLKLPLLLGHSRKSVCSRVKALPFAERDIETITISSYLAQHNNIDYLRVHDVKNHLLALNAIMKLKYGSSSYV